MPLSSTSATAFGTPITVPKSGPIVLYPRAHVAVKYIYNDYTELETSVLPSKVTITLRPHHQCGTCEVEFNATATPFDIRRLNGIFLSVYLGAPDTADGDVQSSKYLQFVGYADSESVKRSPDGSNVIIAARDLSSLLRDLKPMYVKQYIDGTTIDPTPRYSDTITLAINRVLEWAGLSDGQFEIEDDSGLGSTVLSTLTDERGVQGRIPIKHRDISAWEAIEHAAAVANVLVHVELGKIILRKPSDAFALPTDPRTPPAYSFVFGKDLAGYTSVYEVDVTKKFLHNRKGVRLVALEAGGRNIIVADYPPDAEVAPKHAPKLGGTKATKPRKATINAGGGVSNSSSLPDKPRDIISVGGDGVHSQAGLMKIAERYYRERSRQELEGTLTTYVWDEALFALRNGNRVEIKITPDLQSELISRPDEGSQTAFLKEHFKVNDEAARVMLAQIRAQESTLFYVRSITHDWSTAVAHTSIDFISIVEL